MIIFKRSEELTGWLEGRRKEGKKTGFVPTMGALHAGHISLIDISKKNTDLTVCSIFVNPTQFNDPKDFQKYPKTIENDILMLERAGADVLYLPEVNDIYPTGMDKLERYDLGILESLLEGKYRPGHFQGVCQVVRRLLDKVRPDDLFMGQKDYQQCMVIRRLLELTGSCSRLHACPIVREQDGLAMSSRNMRLSEQERKRAPAIYRALSSVRERWIAAGADVRPGIIGNLTADARVMLEEAAFRVDYVEIADSLTLRPLAENGKGENETGANAIALVAAFQGEIRLIDNMLLS